jgi:hypothetical protein
MSLRTNTYKWKNSPKESFQYKAYTSVRGQRERCDNPNNKAYKHYGAKGIKVEYTNDEFVEWWEKEAAKYSPGTKLTVDRIDTNKNYCFENIQLIPWAENVRKSNSSRISRYFAILNWDNLEIIDIVTSMKMVKEFTGMSIPTILKHCKEGRPCRNSRNYYFKYTVRYSSEDEYSKRINIQKESSESAAQTFEDSYIYNSTSVHPWNSGSSALPKRKVCGT